MNTETFSYITTTYFKSLYDFIEIELSIPMVELYSNNKKVNIEGPMFIIKVNNNKRYSTSSINSYNKNNNNSNDNIDNRSNGDINNKSTDSLLTNNNGNNNTNTNNSKIFNKYIYKIVILNKITIKDYNVEIDGNISFLEDFLLIGNTNDKILIESKIERNKIKEFILRNITEEWNIK